MTDSEVAFFDALPRSRGAATALLRDEAGRVLVVKPTYRSGWGLPGGVIELGESPLAACVRECVEEVGFVPELDRLACVDWQPPHTSPDGRPATIFTFAGALLPGQFARVRLPAEELSDAALAEPADLAALLPAALVRRVHACLETPTTRYLENGHPAPWPT